MKLIKLNGKNYDKKVDYVACYFRYPRKSYYVFTHEGVNVFSKDGKSWKYQSRKPVKSSWFKGVSIYLFGGVNNDCVYIA